MLHPSKKQRNKGKCHYPASVPSHYKNVGFRDEKKKMMKSNFSGGLFFGSSILKGTFTSIFANC